MTPTTRSMAYADIARLELRTAPQPELRRSDVLLRVEACGICGSDVASYLHGHYVEPGQVLGHEISAVVERVGADVDGLDVGTRVAVRTAGSCGDCPYCAADKPYLCAGSRARTMGYGRPGGFADRVVVPDAVVGADVIPVPADVPPDELLWAEPLAVAVHAVRRGDVDPRTRLLVVGAGSVGLCVIAAARAAGTTDVVAVEPREERRRAAARLGARALSAEELAGAPADRFSVVVDTSGVVPAVTGALEHLEPGGTLTLLGLGDAGLPWPLGDVDVRASFAYTDDDFRLAVEHLVTGRARLRDLVSHRFDLPDTGTAIAASADDPTVIKAAVFPRSS
ncbi:alcohol dehydrogenase catalytic domain-containing protein [Blastococcus saxobsidens]|uniref:Alcohol dehydrogenase catalytic domain-containing protein n=1 Tax=Blastococcus saxobsidens TaxID=138336 RepID=A0A6L9VZI8_9ACTN|nr:alcohol dehydrogenase catalytic domain-containing protein [Blastococcus saxobsidens]NEK85216.1 alcohol dehydrogenase catalytic domain-containing protein [Blastococcus saxobsidens]